MTTYRGIRYANLAAGNRFDLPTLSTEEFDLKAFIPAEQVPVFPQLPSRLEEHMGAPGGNPPQEEDAFFLNIFTPDNHIASAPLPVMVFIHGGAWVSGAGSWEWYDGTTLAERGVVVVNVNYRIHAAAHLNESDVHLPLEDLACAVRWVNTNIEKFGGDPQNVTLVGQSAGGWYVHALAQQAELTGLFHKIALLSMGTRTPWTEQFKAELRKNIQARHPEHTLKTLPIKNLMVTALQESLQLNEQHHGPRPLGVAGSALLPSSSCNVPENFLDAETAVTNLIVEQVLIRYTTDETGIFFASSEPELKASATDAEKFYQQNILDQDVALMPDQLHQRMTDGRATGYERIRAMSSWRQFQKMPHQLLRAYQAAGIAVELHEFNFSSPNHLLGACHCLDLPFQFGQREPWKHSPMLSGVDEATFTSISQEIMGQLLNFINS